jgi:hypothetical protein
LVMAAPDVLRSTGSIWPRLNGPAFEGIADGSEEEGARSGGHRGSVNNAVLNVLLALCNVPKCVKL